MFQREQKHTGKSLDPSGKTYGFFFTYFFFTPSTNCKTCSAFDQWQAFCEEFVLCCKYFLQENDGKIEEKKRLCFRIVVDGIFIDISRATKVKTTK